MQNINERRLEAREVARNTKQHRRRQRQTFSWKPITAALIASYLLLYPKAFTSKLEVVLFAIFIITQIVAWFYLLIYFSARNSKDNKFYFFCEGKVKLWFLVSFFVLMVTALGVNVGWLPAIA